MDRRFFIKKESALLGDICAFLKIETASTVDSKFPVYDVCSADDPQDHCVTFVKSKKHLDALETEKSTVFLVQSSLKEAMPERTYILLSENAEADFARVAQYFYPQPSLKYPDAEGVSPEASLGENVRIGPGAVVGQGAELGDNVILGPNVVIGPYVRIGANSVVHAGASIMCADIGSQVIVHQNAAIGQAGFGFAITDAGALDIPQLGRVIIENNVHIGACCTIDRGGLQDTVIGAHSYVDNLVQIAHNVRVGRGCVIVSQTGIAGSSQIGDFSILGGQVGVADMLRSARASSLPQKVEL